MSIKSDRYLSSATTSTVVAPRLGLCVLFDCVPRELHAPADIGVKDRGTTEKLSTFLLSNNDKDSWQLVPWGSKYPNSLI